MQLVSIVFNGTNIQQYTWALTFHYFGGYNHGGYNVISLTITKFILIHLFFSFAVWVVHLYLLKTMSSGWLSSKKCKKSHLDKSPTRHRLNLRLPSPINRHLNVSSPRVSGLNDLRIITKRLAKVRHPKSLKKSQTLISLDRNVVCRQTIAQSICFCLYYHRYM